MTADRVHRGDGAGVSSYQMLLDEKRARERDELHGLRLRVSVLEAAVRAIEAKLSMLPGEQR